MPPKLRPTNAHKRTQHLKEWAEFLSIYSTRPDEQPEAALWQPCCNGAPLGRVGGPAIIVGATPEKHQKTKTAKFKGCCGSIFSQRCHLHTCMSTTTSTQNKNKKDSKDRSCVVRLQRNKTQATTPKVHGIRTENYRLRTPVRLSTPWRAGLESAQRKSIGNIH